ncbi:hypothetical protein [Exiguobacterium sp. UBA3491]|uniref:hypothetical protein n=2 Tax=unclassified Exiguobacterium TaxID=2644629 RepID=UPI0025B8EE9E|nr:hypothetical protein [Exiguobacterium sp. UBA3491]
MSTRKRSMTLTHAECTEAIQMRRKGVHVEQIAQTLHVGKATIVRYMKHHGLYQAWREAISGTSSKPNTGNRDEIPFFYLYHLRYNWGWTYERIAKDFGCSIRKVQNAMKRHGFLGMEEAE